MLKPNILARAVALAILLPGISYAEFEISGEAKIEYDMFTSDGIVTGASEAHEAGDALKSEYSLKLFMNADIGEESAFHAEILLADDAEAASERLEGGEEVSQYEILREFYFDTNLGGIDFRLGKQQVVWGTADGIKLLDIINPTDYRELNQNVSEDARIPIWMINVEKYFDSGDSVQLIVSEAQPNFIAGLTDEGNDAGAPFIFKGVDTITGTTNGFLNIAKDMGQTSGIFQSLLQLGGLTGLVGGPMSFTTVEQFTQLTSASYAGMAANLIGSGAVANAAPPGFPNKSLLNAVFVPMMTGLGSGNDVLNAAANGGESLFNGFLGFMMGDASGFIPGTTNFALLPTALSTVQTGTAFVDAPEAIQDAIIASSALLGAMGLLNPANGSFWDLTDDAQRLAFATMMGSLTPEQQAAMMGTPEIQGMMAAFGNGTTNQFTGTLDTANPTSAFDYMGNTTFATFNDFIGMQTVYRQDHPDNEGNFGLRYKGSTDGGMNYSVNYLYAYDPNPIVNIHWEDGATGEELAVIKTVTDMDATGAPTALTGAPKAYDVTTITLDGKTVGTPALLVFQEELNRVNNLGGSFDMALDGTSIPTVIRGEVLYSQGAMAPVIDLDALSIGDLVGALKMVETDYFKYVLGVDLTVLTNMLVSTQLIQMYNLDYIDEGNRYTGDFSTMHLSNGMNKGDEVETFVSLFLSKPFGSDVQHRWNNILIWENEGGYWNRFDVDYSFNDDIIGSIELNSYWGDENTTFGQFKESSNFQIGLKYIF